MATEIAVARNWTDVATTAAEIKWCKSVFEFAAAIADTAKGGDLSRDQMIEMVCEAIAISSERFRPREELLNQVCRDVRFALTAPDTGGERQTQLNSIGVSQPERT